MKRCCICNFPLKDWGNNPWPVVQYEGARCCDYCNAKYVIPARIELMGESDENGGEQR